MIKTYKVGGMTCGHCMTSVKNALLRVEGIKEANITLESSEGTIQMDRPIPVIELQEALSEAGLFFIVEKDHEDDDQSDKKSSGTKKLPFYKKFLKHF